MFTSSFVCPDKPKHKHLYSETIKRGLVSFFAWPCEKDQGDSV